MKAWHLLLGVGVVIGGAMLYGNMNSGGESPISAQLNSTGIKFFRDGQLLRQFDVPPGAPTIEDTLSGRTFVEWSSSVAAWMFDNVTRNITIVAIDQQPRTATLAQDLATSIDIEAAERGATVPWSARFA